MLTKSLLSKKLTSRSIMVNTGGLGNTGLAYLIVVCLGFLISTEAAHVEVFPSDQLVLPHRNASFMCRAPVPLQYCRVEIPGKGTFNLHGKLINSEVSYNGEGLNAGQCGFTINNVDNRNDGIVKCFLGIATDSQESVGMMMLVVARSPKPPVLELSRGTDSFTTYKIGDTLQASCLVRDGRPVANISWYLDDEPLMHSQGLSMATVIDLAKENLQSKMQNLTRFLKATDNGKKLRCIAEHFGYPSGRSEASRQIDVKYPPQPLPEPLEIFGFDLGSPGAIKVTLQANPRPRIEWSIDNERLREGNTDSSGRIEAEGARELGRGTFEVNLRIAQINKPDTEKQYVLTAFNDMGSQSYRIRISTAPEPEGLELGVGSIIGIVLGIGILILIVFLVIFAKTTDRWCFSVCKDRPAQASSGETYSFRSDTESAEGGSKTKKRLLPPIKLELPKFLRKNNNKNTTLDETETLEDTENVKIPLEDSQMPEDVEKIPETKSETTQDIKEGVVYAELDLGNPELKTVVKNDNDKTEYAEIVYTPRETPPASEKDPKTEKKPRKENKI